MKEIYENSTVIMCITVAMGEVDPDSVVPNCTVSECCRCKVPIYVSPSSRAFLETLDGDGFTACPGCSMFISMEQGCDEATPVPGSIQNVLDHIQNLAKQRTERN